MYVRGDDRNNAEAIGRGDTYAKDGFPGKGLFSGMLVVSTGLAPNHCARVYGSSPHGSAPRLRLLVTHFDDSQEVVEIKNDLGLDNNDFQANKKALAAQGTKDVKTFYLWRP